jgi:hypothetical protein
MEKQLMGTQANQQLPDEGLPKRRLKTFLSDRSKNDDAFENGRMDQLFLLIKWQCRLQNCSERLPSCLQTLLGLQLGLQAESHSMSLIFWKPCLVPLTVKPGGWVILEIAIGLAEDI